MITVLHKIVHNLAISGTFGDCQVSIKQTRDLDSQANNRPEYCQDTLQRSLYDPDLKARFSQLHSVCLPFLSLFECLYKSVNG